jgi:hypothetical protein
MISLLKNLKKLGHTIIIYTARQMNSYNHNIGRAIRDIGLVTFQTLEKFNIEYDEIIFGKPIADIYIDDKALNPYINDISYFGIDMDSDEFIHNKVDNNKFNRIKKCDNIIKGQFHRPMGHYDGSYDYYVIFSYVNHEINGGKRKYKKR